MLELTKVQKKYPLYGITFIKDEIIPINLDFANPANKQVGIEYPITIDYDYENQDCFFSSK